MNEGWNCYAAVLFSGSKPEGGPSINVAQRNAETRTSPTECSLSYKQQHNPSRHASGFRSQTRSSCCINCSVTRTLSRKVVRLERVIRQLQKEIVNLKSAHPATCSVDKENVPAAVVKPNDSTVLPANPDVLQDQLSAQSVFVNAPAPSLSAKCTEDLLRSAKPGGLRERVLQRCLSPAQDAHDSGAKSFKLPNKPLFENAKPTAAVDHFPSSSTQPFPAPLRQSLKVTSKPPLENSKPMTSVDDCLFSGQPCPTPLRQSLYPCERLLWSAQPHPLPRLTEGQPSSNVVAAKTNDPILRLLQSAKPGGFRERVLRRYFSPTPSFTPKTKTKTVRFQ